MPDNQIDVAELEKLTNEEGGISEPSTEQLEATSPEPEKIDEAPAPPSGQAIFTDEDLKALEETPFKKVPDIVRGYKELQSQFTKEREKVKPLEPFLDDLSDPATQKLVQELIFLKKNPHIAQQYAMQQGNVDVPPDPRAYDFNDPAHYAEYQKQNSAYNQRQFDQMTKSRFAAIEENQKLDKMKSELKFKYPDSDPDEVLRYATARATAGGYSLEDIYKIREYDNLKSKSLEEARKELNKQIQVTQNTKTPQASTGSTTVQPSEVIAYIGKNGYAAAKKKYGKDVDELVTNYVE